MLSNLADGRKWHILLFWTEITFQKMHFVVDLHISVMRKGGYHKKSWSNDWENSQTEDPMLF